MSDETPPETPAPEKPKPPNPLDTSLVEVLDWIATQASVSVATLRLAIKEQSFDKNLSRRRIKKVLDENKFDAKEIRKKILAHEKKHARLHG